MRREQEREPLPIKLSMLDEAKASQAVRKMVGSIVVTGRQAAVDQRVESAATSEANRRLLWALLDDSRRVIAKSALHLRRFGRIVNRQKTGGGPSLRPGHLATELDWISGRHPSAAGFVSFEYCCEMLELDATRTRDAILAPLRDAQANLPGTPELWDGKAMRDGARMGRGFRTPRRLGVGPRVRGPGRGRSECGDTGTTVASPT